MAAAHIFLSRPRASLLPAQPEPRISTRRLVASPRLGPDSEPAPRHSILIATVNRLL